MTVVATSIRRHPNQWITPLVVMMGICTIGNDRTRAQIQPDILRTVREWRRTREPELARSYLEFLRIPNVWRDLPNIRRNAEYLVTEMNKRNLNSRLLE